ncbi:MAG TPA: T9SS type A sorting domain-containing protein, partial [Chryseolinea sp.]|nr:T9SS type A sorting domain-containing protein [Chryseolinea sp.]
TWTSGDQESIDVDYKIDVPIAFPDDLSVIAFVQNYNSSLDSVRMLQAIIQKISRKTGSTVVAVENDPADKISAVNMYPNPVSNTLNLQLESELHHDYVWKMIDQRGIVVLEGKVNRDLSSPQQVDVSRLASGIYFMAIQSGEKSVVYRKIAVINRN